MRRTLAAAILGISLWIGSLAWSGFIMTSTVLNPDRSEDVAEALLDNDAVRAHHDLHRETRNRKQATHAGGSPSRHLRISCTSACAHTQT